MIEAGTLVGLVVIAGLAIAAAILAVWFGRAIIAPRIQRAVDRADQDEQDEEDAGDRPD